MTALSRFFDGGRAVAAVLALLAFVAAGCGGQRSAADGTSDGDAKSLDGRAADAGAEDVADLTRTDGNPSDVPAADGNRGDAFEGPLAPGVSVTLGLTGGTLQLDDPRGIRFRLSVPEGALKEPVTISVTPVAAVAGRWGEWVVAPSALHFARPATLTIELPADLDVPPKGGIVAGHNDIELLLATTVDPGAHTLTAPLSWLGMPALPDGPPATPLPQTFKAPADPGGDTGLSPDLDRIMTLDLPDETRILLAETQLAVFQVLQSYDKAAPLSISLTALKQRREDPDVMAFLTRTAGLACAAFMTTASAVAASDSHCQEEFNKAYGEKLTSWALVTESLGSVVPADCAPLLDLTSSSAYRNILAGRASQLIRRLLLGEQNDPAGISRTEFLTCQCQFTPNKKWTRSMKIICPRLGVPDLLAFMPISNFGVAADSPLYVSADEQALEDLGLPGDEQSEMMSVGAPLNQVLREMAHAACLSDGSSADLGRLLSRLPDDAICLDDAQRCASTLTAESLDAGGAAGGSITLGPGRMIGADVTSGGLSVAMGGSLRLNGPIAALHCVDDQELQETVEADQLVITARPSGTTADATVARLDRDTEGLLLATPLVVRRSALTQAAGVREGAAIEVIVSRMSAGCGGLYAAGTTRLFNLTLSASACLTCAEAACGASDGCGHVLDCACPQRTDGGCGTRFCRGVAGCVLEGCPP